MNEKQATDRYQIPNFDARMSYIRVLQNHLNTISLLQNEGNYKQLLSSLTSFFIFCSPFVMGKKNKPDFKNRLKALRKRYPYVIQQNVTFEMKERFDDDLMNFQIDLMESIKYILMPLRGEEEVTWETFAEQSNITQ